MTNTIQVISEDRDRQSGNHPIILILDNLRSAYNVGNIFRLAEVCRIEEIITCGYTVTPPHPKLAKTARGCDKRVSCRQFESSLDAILFLKKKHYQIVAVETVANAFPIWDVPLHFPVAFVFGNEAHGISKRIFEQSDAVACLPVFGFKNSLNVANCAAVVTYSAIHRMT